MDAIKKKMQAMKLEKDNAMDRADACEQQAKDANLRAERVGQIIDDYQNYFEIFQNYWLLDDGNSSWSEPTIHTEIKELLWNIVF